MVQSVSIFAMYGRSRNWFRRAKPKPASTTSGTANPRHTTGTQEVIFIKSGRVRVDFYTQEQRFLESQEVAAGDWLILLSGGHGFETIEPTTMIEVKNGPYAGAADKTKFETAERA